MRRLRVVILGAGKVGQSLHVLLRRCGVRSTIVPGRAIQTVSKVLHADVVILAVRDGAIAQAASYLVEHQLLRAQCVVLHCAGALSADVLRTVRAHCAGVAQMHPMMSFADKRNPPFLKGGHAHVQGDAVAVKRAKRLCRLLGLTPRTFAKLDTTAYHAAAGLVANGAAALAAAGAQILKVAGVDEASIPHMLGPLLRSVADNVEQLGLPRALTGPVRRGDAVAVQKHLATLTSLDPAYSSLYRACALAQLPLARALHEADEQSFQAIATLLR